MRRALAVSVACLLSAGCSLAPDYVQPALPVADTLPVGEAYQAQSEAALPTVTYQQLFCDARLQQLIGAALDNNRDLRIAYANLAAARSQVRYTRSARFPDITASGSGSYRQAGSGGGGQQSYAIDAGVAGYELDLFGQLANATAADRERVLGSEAAARTVRLGLISDLALAWLTYAADQDLLHIAQDTAVSAQRSFELTQLRLSGGIAARSEVRQAEQVLATAQGDVARQTAALAQDVNLIRLLVGTPAVDPALLPAGLDEVADSVARLPAGTSSQVLLRRPDVYAAEAALRAANADIGVARAQLFPSISLTGLLGLASDTLGNLFTGGAFSAVLGASGSAPIFDFGGRRAAVEISEAQRDAALAAYEGAIQTAFREVADALAVQGTIADQLAAAQRGTAAAADTARLVNLRYREGIGSSLANLDAQRSFYSAQRQEIAVRLAEVSNRVALYRALGGEDLRLD